MKRWMTGCAAAALMLVTVAPATAQNDGYGYRFAPDGDSALPYFSGLRGSLAFSGSINTSVPSGPTALRASYDVGGGGSVYIGTRLPLGFRVELEGLYRYLPIQKASLGGVAVPDVTGSAQIGAPFVNLLWDLPTPDFPFRPFVGAGIGAAYTAVNARDSSNTYLSGSKWNFAYDFMAGAEVPLSQSSRFTAMYRWIHVNDMTLKCGISGAPTESCKSDLNSQSLDLGLEMDM